MRLEFETRIREALRAAILKTGRVEDLALSDVHLEKPRDWTHGDLACNTAMVLASSTKIPPRQLAEEITSALDLPPELVSEVDIAGPGFINLRLSDTFLRNEIGAIAHEGSEYGRAEEKKGPRIQLEFVSANPTGPLNVVSARAAAVGDSLARILTWTGRDVETEFYVNDGGTQVDLFGASIRARFLELGGFPFDFPEDGYAGAWVGGIARSLWSLLEMIARAATGTDPPEPWVRAFDFAGIEAQWGERSADERASLLADRMGELARERSGARLLVEECLDREDAGEGRDEEKNEILATEHPESEEGLVLTDEGLENEEGLVLTDEGLENEEGLVLTDEGLENEEGLALSDEARVLGQRWAESFPFDKVGVALMVSWQRASLDRFGVRYDAETGAGETRGWFHESSLYQSGSVDETLGHLRGMQDAVYEEDGAEWLATSRYGDEEDRVLVRSDGRPTYFLTDIAYHRNKLGRGYDRVIDIWGPDHHGHVGRMKAAMRMVGASPDWLEVVIAQQVNVLRDGKPLKMSKRGGTLISLNDLVEEAGRDTSRFFFLMRRTSSHLDFDLDLARKTSEENPVYYVQYAFARISSIYEFARQGDLKFGEDADFSRLTAPEELRLMRNLVRFPGEVRAAARALEPHRLTVYLQELAQSFHKFYTVHRVVGEDEELSRARLSLVDAARSILETGMILVGVQPPKARM
jgi:arginyl-tRNA synthetase